MVSTQPDDGGLAITITAQMDLNYAEEARKALLAAIADSDQPIRLDLSEGPATVPALQLILSARRSLQSAGRFAGFGQGAAALLVQQPDAAAGLSFVSVTAAA